VSVLADNLLVRRGRRRKERSNYVFIGDLEKTISV